MMKTTKLTSAIIGKSALAKRASESLKKQNHSFTSSQVEVIISQILEEMKKSLVKCEEIRFPNYFSLKTVIQKPRTAMNLKTKKKMTIPEKKVPKAKFSVNLKDAVAKKK